MGNRSSLNLTRTPDNVDYEVLEANNQLPFFWVLLLDQRAIVDNDDLFPVEPDEDSPYRALQLSRETLRSSAARSAQYLTKFYPELADEFIRFADYIIGLSDRGTIEVDLLEITNFTSPREFRDDTLALLQRLDTLQPLSDRDRNEYISHDPTSLIGIDNYATITPRYSEISNSYSTAEHGDARPSTISTAAVPSDMGSATTRTSGNQPRQLSSGLLLISSLIVGIPGLLFTIGALWLLAYDDEIPSWLSALGVVMGLGCIAYAFVLYRRRRDL